MKHSEVLNRYVNTGSILPEEQYGRLTPSLKKSYLRMRGVAGNYFEWEFKIISDDERIKFIEKKGKKLDGNEIYYLLELSQRKDDIATKIIEKKGEGLTENDVKILLKYSVNKDDIATKIIEKKGEGLNINDIRKLLDYSQNKDNIAIKIINLKGKELDEYLIRNLLYYSENKDDIAIKIIEAKNKRFYDDEEINILLDYAQNKDLIATKIIEGGSPIPEKQYNILSQSFQKSYKIIRGVDRYYGWEFKLLTDNEKINYIEKDKRLEIRYLLDYSQNKDLIATKIIQVKGEKLSGLDIMELFKNSEDKELIKKTLSQNGVNYERINKIINRLNIDTPLIPDNYQSMLQEIKRIKEIMK